MSVAKESGATFINMKVSNSSNRRARLSEFIRQVYYKTRYVQQQSDDRLAHIAFALVVRVSLLFATGSYILTCVQRIE